MKSVSDQLKTILKDRNYRVASAPRIITQWIAGKCFNHSEKTAVLVDLLLISRFNLSQSPQGENQVTDVLDQHCAAFMNEVKNEFDALKESKDGGNLHILETLGKLFPKMEMRKMALPMLRAAVHRINGNVATFRVTPIVLTDDETADSLNLNDSSREWLLAFGDQRRYNIYVVPIRKLGKFLDKEKESVRRVVEKLSTANINHLGWPLSISQKMFAILGCFWGFAALDTILRTNIFPLTEYWPSFMILSLAVLMGAISSIIIGGIKLAKALENRFILPIESDEVLVPSLVDPGNSLYSGSTEKSLSDLPSYSTARDLNAHLKAFSRSLGEARSHFENGAYASYLVEAQSALHSALKAKHFELTNNSSDILSFSQLVNKLRRSGLTLPHDEVIKKWTEIAERAPRNQDNIDFKTAKGYLLYLSKFVSLLKPFGKRRVFSGSTHSKMRKEEHRKDPIPSVLT